MQPDLTSFDPVIAKGDEAASRGSPSRTPTCRTRGRPGAPRREQGEAIRGLEQRYLKQTPPAAIRFNVNPFVIWIWLGAIVGMLGALFALWPGAEARRRRVSDVYAARLARELSGTGA